MQQLPRNFPPQCFRPILPFLMLLIDAARIILFLRDTHASSIHDWRIATLPLFPLPMGSCSGGIREVGER
jgi:hypothetical protein